jgi:hypothetical protein
MTKSERFFSVAMGMLCVYVVGMVGKHVVSPSAVTYAVVSAMSVTTACFVGFVAYDSLKEGLTGRKG